MHKKIEKISKEKLIQSNRLKFKMDYTPPKYCSSFFVKIYITQQVIFCIIFNFVILQKTFLL